MYFKPSSYEGVTPASTSQFALETIIRRNRLQWLYLFSFGVIAPLIDPRLRGILEWRLFFAANTALSAVLLYLGEALLRPGGLTTRRLRIWRVALPLTCLSVGAIVAESYVRFGFDQRSVLATAIVSVYAIGALPLDRSNLQILRSAVAAFLWLPTITALWQGGSAGYSVGFLLIGVSIFCLHQGKIENRDFWQALHANRDLRLARLRAEASAHTEAKLMAERAEQNVIASERSRIAAEWHDTLLAGFSSIGWQLDTAQSMLPEGAGDAEQALALARTMLNHYRTEARLVIGDLQSPIVEHGNLPQVISHALGDFQRMSGVPIEVTGSGPSAVLPKGKVHELIRICQEAVTNALKHANPKQVNVGLRADEGTQEICVEIADDGIGFDPSVAKPGHFGLAIMRERAAGLGGDLQIRTAPGNGTTIAVTLPIGTEDGDGGHTRILLVEDQFFSRLALHSVCEKQKNLEIVAEASTGAAGLRLFQLHRPDVTILDLGLPDMSGYEVIKAVRHIDPCAAILVLSNFDGTDHLKRAVEAGADGYLTKSASREELLASIASLANGRKHLSNTAYPDQGSGPLTELTARERDVLEQLVQGLPNREIGARLGITQRTVSIHMERIFDKLGASDRTQVVAIALRQGLVDLPENHNQDFSLES